RVRPGFRKTSNFFASSANSSGDILCNAFKSIDAGASGAITGAVVAVVGRGSVTAAMSAAASPLAGVTLASAGDGGGPLFPLSVGFPFRSPGVAAVSGATSWLTGAKPASTGDASPIPLSISSPKTAPAPKGGPVAHYSKLRDQPVSFFRPAVSALQ